MQAVEGHANFQLDLLVKVVAAHALLPELGGGFSAPGVAAATVEDGDAEREAVIPRGQKGYGGAVDSGAAIVRISDQTGQALDFDGVGVQSGGGFAFGLRLHIGTVLQGLGFALFNGDDFHRQVAQLVGKFQLRGEIEAHHAQ